MPTLLQISNELTEQFIHAKNKVHSATNIVVEINSLQYVDSKKPIEYEAKIAIANVIECNLITHPEESTEFAKLKSHIFSGLDTMNEKKKIPVSLAVSFETLKRQIEKYFHKH